MKLVVPAFGLGLVVVGYARWLRPRMARWGTTTTEVARPLAGDDVLPEGQVTATNAVTVDAAPAAVWPWIVQLGRGRGFYTYTWIENLLGADIHNLDRIEPALQTIGEGDRIWLTPECYLGRPGQYWRVRQVQPGRALVLEQRPPANPTACTWALVVEPSANGETRLLSRHRELPTRGIVLRPWIAFMAVGAFVMERKLLLGIKHRAERHDPALASIAGRVHPSPFAAPATTCGRWRRVRQVLGGG